MPGEGAELDTGWWRARLAGTTCTPMTPAEVDELRRVQGVAALPAAYEGFLRAAGRGCSHVWEADQYAYLPDLLQARAGAEELLAECGHPFALGPDDVVITLTGGYQFQFLRPGPADPVTHHYLEGDPGPVAQVPFTELILGQLPGGRFGWRWDKSGEAGIGRWAVWHFTREQDSQRRRLLRWGVPEGVWADTLADLVRLAAEGVFPPIGAFFGGAERYSIDDQRIRFVSRDGRTVEGDVADDGRLTFGAEEVRAYALSCDPPVDVPLAEIQEALHSFAGQERLLDHGDGVYSVPRPSPR